MELHLVHHLLQYHLRGIFEKHFNFTYGLVQLLITILHVLPTVCQANFALILAATHAKINKELQVSHCVLLLPLKLQNCYDQYLTRNRMTPTELEPITGYSGSSPNTSSHNG